VLEESRAAYKLTERTLNFYNSALDGLGGMNIQSALDDRLWVAVQDSYENGNYTTAIMDAIFFVAELIREKTGLDSDGAPLTGQAFGGDNPPLKVNALETESEKNVQRGVESILRGVFQAVRNPRSHGKHEDTKQDADAFLLFLGYLLRTIDKSRSVFTKASFLERVFDTAFVPKELYADALAKEIPPKHRRDVFIEAYRRKREGKPEKLTYFYHALWNHLDNDDRAAITNIISDELETTEGNEDIRYAIQFIPESNWPSYRLLARLRAEHLLIESIRTGSIDIKSGKTVAGGFGTWAARIAQHFTLKEEFEWAIYNRLRNDDICVQEYTLMHFLPRFAVYWPENPPAPIVRLLQSGLRKGQKRLYTAVNFYLENIWDELLKDAAAEYRAKHGEKTPFDELDDDIPF
jgi:uncharacterized protein (TIGR02391 family)